VAEHQARTVTTRPPSQTVTERAVLYTPAEVAALLKVSERTMKRMRTTGTGPAWFRVGEKHIRYPAAGVREYLLKVRGDHA
jgi:excisionase family DNA binding protein